MVSTVVTDDEVKWGQKGIFSINSKNVSKVGRNFKSNLIFHFQFSSYSHVQLHSTPSVSNWSDFNLQQTLRYSFHAVVIRSLADIIDKKISLETPLTVGDCGGVERKKKYKSNSEKMNREYPQIMLNNFFTTDGAPLLAVSQSSHSRMSNEARGRGIWRSSRRRGKIKFRPFKLIFLLLFAFWYFASFRVSNRKENENKYEKKLLRAFSFRGGSKIVGDQIYEIYSFK